ncbi:Dynein assembly factor 3, axonemal [Entophlyctis luteolus]|nr:Dynein assembly factor 3, axonemal [Entophlyctis luteolus]
MEGAGSAGVWGFSPALDLFSLVDASAEECNEGGEAKITEIDDQGGVDTCDTHFLILGARDARHVIKTVARLGRHRGFSGAVHFHIYEEQAPLIARTILLLALFLGQKEEISQIEQSQVFLEVFGNTFLRSKTYDSLKALSSRLIKLICDEDGALAKLFDFSALRFRDRDDIECVFKFWRDDARRAFDVGAMWSERLRRLHGARYDVRENMVDWDYHMKLMKREVTVIHKTEYARWREHGLAFEVRDAAYDRPNRSLATVDVMKHDGVSVAKWGYFNDVITGPFACYGVESDNVALLQKVNEQHKHTSAEVSEYNVLSYLEELKRTLASVEALAERVKVHILPPAPASLVAHLQKKLGSRSRTRPFTAVVAGNSVAHLLARIPPELLGDRTQVVAETARFMLDLNAEQVAAFSDAVARVGADAGLCRDAAAVSSRDYIGFRVVKNELGPRAPAGPRAAAGGLVV